MAFPQRGSTDDVVQNEEILSGFNILDVSDLFGDSKR